MSPSKSLWGFSDPAHCFPGAIVPGEGASDRPEGPSVFSGGCFHPSRTGKEGPFSIQGSLCSAAQHDFNGCYFPLSSDSERGTGNAVASPKRPVCLRSFWSRREAALCSIVQIHTGVKARAHRGGVLKPTLLPNCRRVC